MMEALFALQSIAWPAAISFCVWRAAKTIDAHLTNVARELNDPLVHAAARKADDAWRKAQQLTDALDHRSAETNEEIAQLKAALIDR
jgi:hypothetical protein